MKIPPIRPWIVNRQLECATKIIKIKDREISWFSKIIDSVDVKYLNKGSYAETLRKSFVTANIELLDFYIRTQSDKSHELLNDIFDNKNYWKDNPSLASRIYIMASDLASLLNDMDSSIAYLHRSLGAKGQRSGQIQSSTN